MPGPADGHPELPMEEALDEALDDLLDRPPSDRAAALTEIRGRDPELAAALSDLLRAADRAPGYLDSDAVSIATPALGDLLADETQGGLSEGAHLGPYRLLEPLGRGGMSQVYLAERDDGEIRQKVAIKILGSLAASPELLARFRAERQILASLRHPGIARVLDAGTAPGGVAYLVMEHIDGRPVDAYCRDGRLSVDERLELFEDICRAVEGAHQRLVVHRDLKPSNILVLQHDGRPRAKLLDFGIAKLLDPTAIEAIDAPPTRTGLLLLTPEYAAPEQIRGEPITVATDVFALGVVLFELLTGERPRALSGLSPAELERAVGGADAPRASGVGDAEEGPGSPAWRRDLAGDLDTILAKALHSEPGQRYGSVEALRRDLERFRSKLPIEARPATLAYRSRKFLRRHRWPVAAAATAIVAGLTFVGLLLRERSATASERDRAREQAEIARTEASKADRVKDFLLGLFRASSPRERLGRELTASDLLARGVERADALEAEPLVQAELLSVLGSVLTSMGRSGEALGMLERSLALSLEHLEADHPEVADRHFALAMAGWRTGKLETAETHLRKSLAGWQAAGSPKEIMGKRRLGRFLTDRGLYPEAESLLVSALARKRAEEPDGDLETAHLLRNLAILNELRGDVAQAADDLSEALELAKGHVEPDDPEIDTFRSSLSAVLFQLDRYVEAEALARQSLELTERAYGTDHAFHATHLGNLALALKGQERYEEAEAANLEALAIRRAAFGEDHSAVALSLNNLGSLALARGRLDEAESYVRDSMAIKRRVYDDRHPSLLDGLYLLGKIEEARGRPGGAVVHFEAAAVLAAEHFGADHSETVDYERLAAEAREAAS